MPIPRVLTRRGKCHSRTMMFEDGWVSDAMWKVSGYMLGSGHMAGKILSRRGLAKIRVYAELGINMKIPSSGLCRVS